MPIAAKKEHRIQLRDQRHFELTPKQWQAFMTALDHPVRKMPRLERLMRERSILE